MSMNAFPSQDHIALRLRRNRWYRRHREEVGQIERARRKTDPEFLQKRRKQCKDYYARNKDVLKSKRESKAAKRKVGVLSCDHLASILGVKTHYIHHLFHDGILPEVKRIGWAYAFTPSQVLHLTKAMEQCRIATNKGVSVNRKKLKELLRDGWEDQLAAIDCR